MGKGNLHGKWPPHLGLANTGMEKATGWKSPFSPGDLRSQELGCELLKEHESPGEKELHTFLVSLIQLPRAVGDDPITKSKSLVLLLKTVEKPCALA